MSYIFGKLWHLAIIWAIRKAFQCILQGVRFLLANQTRLSPTSDNESYLPLFFFLVKHVSLFSLSSMFLWFTALNILLQLSLYILPCDAVGVHYATPSLLKVMLKRARRVECWSKYVFVRRQMEGSMICFHRVRDRNSGLDFATLPPLSPTKP